LIQELDIVGLILKEVIRDPEEEENIPTVKKK
jgi:hypothetical protein